MTTIHNVADYYVPSPEALQVWTRRDSDTAKGQGWCLILLRNGKGAIMKTSRPKKRDGRIRPRDIFETHEDARAFVEKQVGLDDPLACKAIMILARWLLTQGNIQA